MNRSLFQLFHLHEKQRTWGGCFINLGDRGDIPWWFHGFRHSLPTFMLWRALVEDPFRILRRHGLRVKLHDRIDHFQFDSGAAVESQQRAYFPRHCQARKPIFGVSVLRIGIPFLASGTLCKVGMRHRHAHHDTDLHQFGFEHATHKSTWTSCSQHCSFCRWCFKQFMLEEVVKTSALAWS